MRNGTLITPAASADILEGITRDSILQIARDLNIPIEQRSIDRTELYIADEAFLSGSSARVIPIISIDKRTIGTGAAGPITQKLAESYDAAQKGNNLSKQKGWIVEI